MFFNEDYLEKKHLELSIDNSLISIGAYEERDNLLFTPSITHNLGTSTIKINIPNISIRKKLESGREYISSALQKNYIVDRLYLNKDETELIIEYEDIRNERRYIFNEPIDFISSLRSTNKLQLLLDKKTTIDLRDYPHLLLTGGSGSGKSYCAQQLIAQAIFKNYDISILDYKKSYQAFKKYCNVSFSVDEIVEKLRSTIEELHKRQEKMDPILEDNPTALACEYGFPVKLIVIEEYIALMNSGADKKVLEEIEKMLLEISTTGRSLNIHIMMILQVSAATNLNTSIRANLPIRILFGNPDKTTYTTTFSTSDFPELTTRKEKGEGLIQIDGSIYNFSASTLEFGMNKLLEEVFRYKQ